MSDIPPCEKDFETLFGEWLVVHTEWMGRMEEKQDGLREDIDGILTEIRYKVSIIEETVAELWQTFERFRPMIERYEQAAKANGFRAQRAALKGKNNG